MSACAAVVRNNKEKGQEYAEKKLTSFGAVSRPNYQNQEVERTRLSPEGKDEQGGSIDSRAIHPAESQGEYIVRCLGLVLVCVW